MNKKKIVKLSLSIICLLLIGVYFVNLIYGLYNKKKYINETELSIIKLNKDIQKEIRNQKIIEKTNKDFLTTAYFNKEENVFENYIRELFSKYNIKINIYQGKINEKNYSELDIGFTANAFDFFNLIKETEEGKKIIVIKRLSIIKGDQPNLKVTMKVGGFYKE